MHAFLLTWACYGAHLPGDAGSVHPARNQFGSPFPDNRLFPVQTRQDGYVLDLKRGQIVLKAIQQVCSHRSWTLWAAHVRTTHVHAVVTADQKPEIVLNTFRAYGTRALNKAELDAAGRFRWARHGSTKHLWTRDAVAAAIHYVVHRQGEPMAVYESPSSPLSEPRA